MRICCVHAVLGLLKRSEPGPEAGNKQGCFHARYQACCVHCGQQSSLECADGRTWGATLSKTHPSCLPQDIHTYSVLSACARRGSCGACLMRTTSAFSCAGPEGAPPDAPPPGNAAASGMRTFRASLRVGQMRIQGWFNAFCWGEPPQACLSKREGWVRGGV